VDNSALRAAAPECALALDHSWPLWERDVHLDLGHVLNCVVADALSPATTGALTLHHAGLWECDLEAQSRLTWSGGVYDIFGLERGTDVSRELALSLYTENSRAKLESLRRHAIRHKRGFTIDVEIRAAAVGEDRKVRIVATPELEQDRVKRLVGIKLAL